MPDLLEAIEEDLFETYIPVAVRLPFAQGNLISLFHDQGRVERLEHSRGGVVIEGSVPGRLLARFRPYVMGEELPEVHTDLADTEPSPDPNEEE